MSRFPRFRAASETECEHVRELMSDYVDSELAVDERERVERHVTICPRCHTVLANLRRTIGALAGLGTAPTPEADRVAEAAKRSWRERSR